MAFSTFLMGIGMVGTSFLVGVVVRSFWTRERVAGAGVWLVAMLFMGLVAAVASAFRPVVEPLWMQYALFVVVPFALGFVVVLVLTRGAKAPRDEK